MYSFKSSKINDYETYLSTRPKKTFPLPLDFPNVCESNNLNYKLYQERLTTSSNVYLNSPIYNKPVSRSYYNMQKKFINGSYKIVLQDMQELN